MSIPLNSAHHDTVVYLESQSSIQTSQPMVDNKWFSLMKYDKCEFLCRCDQKPVVE